MPQCGCSGGSTGGGGETNPPVTVIRPDRETTFIAKVEFRGLNLTDHYEYDRHGNISKRIIGGKSIYYTYDDIDRLVREDNAALNKTYFYEYDDFGNIEKVTTYNYTTGNSLTGGVTKTYSYDSSKRLISVTENGVTQNIGGYDALGNPSNYKGNTLTWTRGRMLASCGSNSYLYDMDGVRQEKTVNGVTHTYYTDGTKILAEKVGDKVFEYYYDAQGIIAFKYDGAVYYFKKNLMGDIDRIYDANKNLVAEYKYDAWGNHRVYTGTGIDITDNSSYNNSVAKLNPFRYRGYYYDTETGLYYLNSRYYDPAIGRFINADDISYIQPTEINGLNLFAYCGNNPVMYSDNEGNMPNWLKWLIGGIAFVGAAALTVLSGGSLTPVFVGMGISIISEGLIQGAITATNGGDFWQGLANGAADGAIWGGIFALGGAVVRTARILKNGVVIGESMSRVEAAAKQVGALTYKAPGKNIVKIFGRAKAFEINKALNKAWIKRMTRWGVKIYDIGLDLTRISRSPFYAIEAGVTASYWNLLKMLFR